MGIFDWKHWIVLLIVVVLVFGTKKLKNFGSDLGESIKGFRKAMNDDEHKPTDYTAPPAQPSAPVQPVQSAQPVAPIQPAGVPPVTAQPVAAQPPVNPVPVEPAPVAPVVPAAPSAPQPQPQPQPQGQTLEGQATPVHEPQRKD